MFYVEVQRFSPYLESLWYEFDDLEEAIDFANENRCLMGVDDCYIYDDDENGIEY